MRMRVWGLSKKGANYKPAPTPDVRCERCKYMFPPLALGGCRLVRGLIQGLRLAMSSPLGGDTDGASGPGDIAARTVAAVRAQ